MSRLPFSAEAVERAHRIAAQEPPAEVDPRVEALVTQLIGRVADKWTMLILEELTERGRAALHAPVASACPASARRC